MKIQYRNDPISNRGLKWMKDKLSSHETIEIANGIIQEYKDDGYILTLRQLYYQFVGRGLLEENSYHTYKNMGNLFVKARNNGLMSWKGIEDGSRGVNGVWYGEENDWQVVSGLEGLLSLDFWRRQDNYVEVWVEKEALINVVARACRPLKCPHMATKGYLSTSEAWCAGQRFLEARRAGKNVIMIHLGDHDPEGIDMTNDNRNRLEEYSNGSVDVRRLALTMEQVEQYDPPPSFIKEKSSRHDRYVEEFGITECWELDALEPKVIVDLIKQEVTPLINDDAWKVCRTEQTEKRYHLEKIADNWDSIKNHIDDIDPRDPDDNGDCSICDSPLDEDNWCDSCDRYDDQDEGDD